MFYPGLEAFMYCLGARPKERVVILCDRKAPREAVEIIAAGCKDKGLEVGVVSTLPSEVKEDFPPGISKRLLQADLIILATSESWYQAPLRRKLKYSLSKRVVDCYGITAGAFKTGGLCANPAMLKKINQRVKKDIRKGSKIRILTSGGGEFSAVTSCLSCECGDYRLAGSGGNLPAGEISIGLEDKTACGKLVFDQSIDLFGQLKGRRIVMAVKQGKVVGVSGKNSRRWMRLLDKDPRLARIAEIGIGTNPFSLSGRSILEDEKKLGAVHIGFGNDTSFGGRTPGPHYDAVISRPTVEMDGERIVDKGRILSKLES